MKSLLDVCFAEMQHHGDTISTQTARSTDTDSLSVNRTVL